MKNELRSYYLQQMGITEWHLRGTTHKETSSCYRYTLINTKRQPMGLLLADVDIDITDEIQQRKEQQLLAAICRALQLNYQSNLQQSLSIESLLSHTQYKIIILMGERVTQYILGGTASLSEFRQKRHCIQQIPVIVTYSPKTLLTNGILKAETWRDLQPIVELLHD